MKYLDLAFSFFLENSDIPYLIFSKATSVIKNILDMNIFIYQPIFKIFAAHLRTNFKNSK